MKISTNGVNLLQQMMLPRIQINPMNNEIGVLGGGELQLRINGAKAEVEEIKALQPSDIIRIEYHDNPGLRYGNAEVVLDYIVRRPETGGNFGVDLSQGMNAMWGDAILQLRQRLSSDRKTGIYTDCPSSAFCGVFSSGSFRTNTLPIIFLTTERILKLYPL